MTFPGPGSRAGPDGDRSRCCSSSHGRGCAASAGARRSSRPAAASVGLLPINQPLGHLIDRARPYVTHPAQTHLLIARSHDPSFPSDHATGAFALAFGIWLYDRTVGTVLLVLAAVLAFARVYVGTHYTSDVIAGALMGVGVSPPCCTCCRRAGRSRPARATPASPGTRHAAGELTLARRVPPAETADAVSPVRSRRRGPRASRWPCRARVRLVEVDGDRCRRSW